MKSTAVIVSATQSAIFISENIGENKMIMPMMSATTPYWGVLYANCPSTAPNMAGSTKLNALSIYGGMSVMRYVPPMTMMIRTVMLVSEASVIPNPPATSALLEPGLSLKACCAGEARGWHILVILLVRNARYVPATPRVG